MSARLERDQVSAELAHRRQTRIATLERQYGWTEPAATGSTVPDLIEYGQCDLCVGRPLCTVRGCTARRQIIRRSPGKAMIKRDGGAVWRPTQFDLPEFITSSCRFVT
jgi:hypothetical protein